MAQRGNQLDREGFCCLCQSLLKDPLTLSCGHSYCKKCIKTHWDKEDKKKIYSCPQCRETFTPRPKLRRNTMLADLVEELKKTEAADHCYAGAEDVACDVCTGRKRKSHKSCLICLASFCEEHLQHHYQSSAFKKHKLVEPSKNLQENICPLHNKVMDIFCRTDQQCICYLCSVDEHKDHDTVSAAAERTQKQRELELSLEEIQKRLQDRSKDQKMLDQKVKAVNLSADKAVDDTGEIIMMMHVLQRRNSDVKQQIRSQQKTEVSRVKDLEEKLQQEMTELKSREAELKQLLQTDNPNQFLLNYRSLSALSPSAHSSTVNVQPRSHFEDMTAAVAKVKGQLQDVLTKTWTNISWTETQVDVSLPQPDPETKAEFLRYSQKITLDPNTVNTWMLLSEENRKVTFMDKEQSYSSHPDRFTDVCQVLSRESLTGRCYWEVKLRGGVHVAVSYKKISRAGDSKESRFELNETSWALVCFHINSCEFCHNGMKTRVSNVDVSRVGVYLDHSAGLLSFYRVSDDTMTLLHRVQTTFTQPLYAGVGLNKCGTTAEFCKLKWI